MPKKDPSPREGKAIKIKRHKSNVNSDTEYPYLDHSYCALPESDDYLDGEKATAGSAHYEHRIMAEILNTIDTENNGQTLCSNEVDMCTNVSGIILSDLYRHSDCHLQMTTVQGQCEIETSPSTYEILYEALRCSLPAPYILNSTSSDIQILSFYNNSGKTVIKSAINICRNFKVNISIHQITVSADHEIWEGMPSSLEELYDEQVSETVNFIRNMNKFFDCMNVRSLFEGRNKRNPNLDPYRNLQDVRLNWLKTGFMNYLSTWKDSVVNRQGNFTKSQQAGMQLSYQTLQGLQISVNSITECTEFLLNEGAPFVLTHNFNQDPLEQHFGHLRHKTGANNNPRVYEVRNIMTQIRTIGAQASAPKHGNTQRGNMNRVIDNTKLPRRRAIMF